MRLPRAGRPLFVARQTYRRRRLMDAARLLPILGAVLLGMPLLWGGAEGGGTARAGMYLFGVWFGLIVAAFWLVRGLRPEPEDHSEGGG